MQCEARTPRKLGAKQLFATGNTVRTHYWSKSTKKRAFDIAASAIGLSTTFVVAVIVCILVKMTSKGPALFCQERVGLNGRLFTLYKFRTMLANSTGAGLTRDGDARLTKVGRVLRKLKFDEIPQFYNVLRGDMSLVGPRPKLPEYSSATDWQYRPGITGLATLAFRREEELLANVPARELEEFYDSEIRPLKARLDRWYMNRASFVSDLVVIWKTAVSCISPSPLRHVKAMHQLPARVPVSMDEQDTMAMSLEAESVE